MSFIRTETWSASEAGLPADRPSRFKHQPAVRNIAALVLALSVEGSMIAALLLFDGSRKTKVEPAEHGIALIDIASSTAQPEGAANLQAKPQVMQAPISKIDATVAPPIRQEWSVTTLPPAPPTPPAPLAPSAPTVAGTGLGTSGAGGGAGYDPYAFASYRPPSQGQTHPGAGGPPSLQPDAQVRLEMLLRQRLGRRNIQVTARLRVDTAGHVVKVELLSGPATLLEPLSTTATGFPLCTVDPARTADTAIVLTFNV